MHHINVDDITRFVSLNLVAKWEGRSTTVLRIARKSGGVLLWAELAVDILNAAIGEGATQNLIDSTILEMPGDLDGLYEWLMSTLSPEEKASTLALFQWVILGAEPMRLNDLQRAVRTNKSWAITEMTPENALTIDPPSSLQELAHSAGDDNAFDSPYQFHRWIRRYSVGLLEIRPETGGTGFSNEPLGLQRVQVIHDSVRAFFMSGRGFAALDKHNDITLYSHSFSTEDVADISHYVLLNACINYLNMTDFECLGGGGGHGAGCLLPAPMTSEESQYWRKHVHDQRRMVISSYPFLQYAVDNLLFHMLSPRRFRYYLPQKEVLALFAADGCRLWRRWTALLGVGPGDPDGVLAACSQGSAHSLLDPIYGVRYRLQRVFKRVSGMAARYVPVAGPELSPAWTSDSSMTVASATVFAAAAAKARRVNSRARKQATATEKLPENQKRLPIPPAEPNLEEPTVESSALVSPPHAPAFPPPLKPTRKSGLKVTTDTTVALSPARAQARQRKLQKPIPSSATSSPESPELPDGEYTLSTEQKSGMYQKQHTRTISYSSTYVPSIFSPVGGRDGAPVSPLSVNTLMSPLSALEASFESSMFAKQRLASGGGTAVGQ